MHYHVVTNGVRAAEPYPTATAAEAAVQAALAELRVEKQLEGYVFEEQLVTRAATLATWDDQTTRSGWQMIEAVACSAERHEPAERMSVRAELWGLSADEAGIWLINGGDAWRSGPIAADSEPHYVVEELLDEHHALGDAKIIHSTSWRAEDESVILTYVAALDCPDVRDHWPDAQLVSTALGDVVGKPAPHDADAPPLPRYVDVLLHAIRHLRFLLDYDVTAAESLSPAWRRHLQAFAPALAGMYSDAHRPEVWHRAG